MVSPFHSAHTFCASQDIRVLKTEKADLGKGYEDPKGKLEVTTHFSEIIELHTFFVF